MSPVNNIFLIYFFSIIFISSFIIFLLYISSIKCLKKMINKCISNCNKCIKSGKDYLFSFFYLFKRKKKDFNDDKKLAQELQEISDSQIKESISKYDKKEEVIINNKEEKKKMKKMNIIKIKK